MKLMGKKVFFCDDFKDKDWINKVDLLPNGSIVLLENLRFYKEETDNDESFSELLSSFCDIYVNEAFGTSHRAHASTYGMAKNFDTKLAGFLVNKELQFISEMLSKTNKPFVVIIGGSKIKDKNPIIT